MKSKSSFPGRSAANRLWQPAGKFCSFGIDQDIELRYWRSKSKAGVDFVIEQNGAIIPTEIKSAMLKPQIPGSIASFISKYQTEKACIACNALFADKMVEKTEIHWTPLYHVQVIVK